MLKRDSNADAEWVVTPLQLISEVEYLERHLLNQPKVIILRKAK